MAFTPPFTAVPGEKITSAGHNTSIRDNLNHIWGVIGGNPGANNLVPVSTGASASAWAKLPDVALADQKISQLDQYLPDAGAASLRTHVYETDALSVGAPSTSPWYIFNMRYRDYGVLYAAQMAVNLFVPTMYIRLIVAGSPGPWYRIWNAQGMGSGSGLDADTLRTLAPGNGSGAIPISNGTLNTNLNAALLSGTSLGNANGQVPISNGVVNVNLNAQLHAGLTAGNATGNIPVSNGVLNATLNAALLSGLSVGNASGNIPQNNTVMCVNLNANFLAGLAAGNAPGNIPVNNGVINANLNAALLSSLAVGNASGNIPQNNTVMCVNLNANFLAGLAAGNGSGNIPVNNGALNTNLNAQYFNSQLDTAFAKLAGGASYTTRPDYNGAPVATFYTGTYTGNGAASQVISTPGINPRLLFIARHGSSYWTIYPTGIGIQANVSPSNNGEISGIGFALGSFTVTVASGTNASGISYPYLAIG